MSEQFINQNTETVKKDLIDDIQRRQENGIIEKTNADLIIKLINNAEDSNEALMIAALGTTYNRTGFQFDKRLEKMSNTIKYFKKNEELSFTDGSDKPHHKLIIGDNYDALQNLLIEYKGKIDVIYIDPPYGANDMGDFADTSYDNTITRDNLLSMLYPRLFLARQLLSDEGIIYVSIDDKNQAYISCLMNEIFAERNYIDTFINRSNPRGNQAKKHTASEHEYILCYAKNKTNILPLGFIKDEIEFTSEDENGKYEATGLRKRGAGSLREEAENEYYPIYYSPENKEITIIKKEGYIEILPKLSDGRDGRWRWARENIMSKNNLLEAKLVKRNGKQEYDIFVKKYFTGNEIKKIKSIFYEKEVNNENATEELQEIFKEKVFSYPKPVYTIQKLINISSKKDSVILDFFAGSGTTAHALLKQNDEDKLQRTFILVQLPEIVDIKTSDSNETKQLKEKQIKLLEKLDLPLYLSNITFERINRIMTGHSYKNKDEGYKWQQENEPYGGSLDVYEIAEVSNAETQEGKTAFDVIDETLYGKEKFENVNDKIKWVCENFDKTQRGVENDSDYQNRIEEERNATRSH